MKYIKVILLFVLIAFGWQKSNAYDFMVDGLCYNINNDGASVTVTWQQSPNTEPYITYPNLSGPLLIPSSVTYNGITYSVTSIGEKAFYFCRSLTSVRIPNSVKVISSKAFYNCSGLTGEFVMPNSVTSMGDMVFVECKGLTSIVLSESIQKIGDRSFWACRGLEGAFVIPNSVKWIGKYAFYYCDGLTSITNGESLMYIDDYAFRDCHGLSSVRIPNTVTTIGCYAFENCKGLMSIIIPNSVNTIGEYAFLDCIELKSISSFIENPNNVNLGYQVFHNVNNTICNLIVPSASINLYKNAEQWKDFLNVKPFASSISLNKVIVNKFVGQTEVMSATILPTNALQTKTWTSSNPSIANVDENGIVTAEALGNATITATTTDGTELSASCEVNVVQPVTSISLSQTSASMFQSDTITLIATVLPDNAYNKNLAWTSSKTSVATVDQNGKVTAKKVGTATITATTTDGTDFSASCNVNVTGITDIEFNKASTNLQIGDSETLVATIIPSDVINKTLTWTSSNSSVATVDQNGKVTAKALGVATITATTTDGSNLSASCEVYVYNRATSISLSQSSLSMNVGQNASLTATISPDNTLAHQYPIQWTSSNTSVATVDATGKVDAKGNGTATITASTTDDSNLSATCQVTVTTLATSITLDRSQIIMYKGSFDALTATILPETTSNKNVSWSSSNSSIVSVDNAGNINAKATGIATIKATTTDGTNLSATCRVEVYNPVTNVYLNYSSLTMARGETKQITATVYPSNAYNKKLSWSSSNPSVAEVDSTGLVTAINVGNTVISATTTDGSNITATCNVEVRVYANDVILNKHETSIYAGGAEQLTAQVLPEDAYNTTVTWRTTNYNVASVTSNGLVSANKVGVAQIIATCNGISDTCTVNVMGITSLTLDKHDLTLDIEATGTLNATVEPQEAINKNLTWRSLNTSVVTVTNTGVVTPKGVGSTKIIVQTTDGSNLSDTCVVTVIPAYDLYPTTTELTHVRGQSDFSAVIPFWMSNKTAISGLQFDITLPTGVTFATVDDYPDVWLDANRKARNHTVDVNLISGSKYRVLVSSPTNNTFKGNEGVVLYMRLNVDRAHPIGSYYINTSNVIFVEPDETQHTGYNKSVKIDYKYLLGDADGDARVDVADYTVTALYILNRPTEVFYSDAANVNGDYNITVTDLVGITNISLGIRPHEYRPVPAIMMDNETQVSMPSLNASVEGDNIVALSIDNDTPLAGMQLDLQLPQGMTLADATLEGRAVNYQLGANTLANGRVRLLISSFGDKDIEAGNDAVIKLVLAGDNVNNEMLYITGAQAASRDLRSYELNDLTMPVGTTSIDDIGYSYDKLSIYGKGNTIVVNSPSTMTVQLVHVNGMVMPVEIKPGHNTIEVGGHGVYIIRVGNNVYKVRL